MSKTKKKPEEALESYVFSADESTTSMEIIGIADELMKLQSPELKFEHLFLWWMSSAPAEA